MELLVDTIIEDERWDAFGLACLAERAARATFVYLGMQATGFTICLMGCSDTRIVALNSSFRGKAHATNVLSWPSEDRAVSGPGSHPLLPDPGNQDDPLELGDVAIAWETCVHEAEEAGKPMADHVTHLVIHGLLHLLGYDHVHDADATLMEGNEVAILARLGISDPYS